MNKWFESTFLPSLFERAGTGKPMWLTRKQTAICTENMDLQAVRVENFAGYGSHNNYFCEWNGRCVSLCYSKKNGCGTIQFGMNQPEQELAARESELSSKIRNNELMERRLSAAKRHPERYRKIYDDAVFGLQSAKEQLKDSIEYGDPESDVEFFRNLVLEMQEKVRFYAPIFEGVKS